MISQLTTLIWLALVLLTMSLIGLVATHLHRDLRRQQDPRARVNPLPKFNRK